MERGCEQGCGEGLAMAQGGAALGGCLQEEVMRGDCCTGMAASRGDVGDIGACTGAVFGQCSAQSHCVLQGGGVACDICRRSQAPRASRPRAAGLPFSPGSASKTPVTVSRHPRPAQHSYVAFLLNLLGTEALRTQSDPETKPMKAAAPHPRLLLCPLRGARVR